MDKAIDCWTAKEKKFLKKLNTPARIQDYLDSLKYNVDNIVRSPRYVMKTKKAHCFDGALFAACAMEFNKQACTLFVLYANGNDDDHVLTVFRHKGYFGAIAKSNYVALGWRDPVYKNLHELAMSYFDGYFVESGFRTLRTISHPFNIFNIKDIDWRRTDEDLDPIGKRMDKPGKIRLLPAWMTEAWLRKNLKLAEKRWRKASKVGADPRGAF